MVFMDLAHAKDVLHAGGKRITPERKLLLRIISENAHIDARELYVLARKEDPRINLSTVYRTVGLLKELGLVAGTGLGESHEHFEVHGAEHYHLVCLGCGRVIEIPPVEAVRRLGEQKGFEIVGVNLELLGYCPDCVNRVHEPSSATIDLREAPQEERPGRIAAALAGLQRGDLLDVVWGTDRPSDRALLGVDCAPPVTHWRDGALWHLLLRKG
jgi:Fur family transcriptional regulator, ferric uptake regulator